MIDFDATTCRICLEVGAIYPIFERNEEFESVYTQLAVCLQEKLEDVEGYPRNICSKCKNTSETLANFIATYEKTNSILKSKIIHVKSETNEEYVDVNNDELGSDQFMYELQISNIKPEIEVKDTAELLESLSHLTVKRIKVESNLDSQEPACVKKENNVRRTKGQPRKTAPKKGSSEKAKKVIAKPASKRTVKPAVANKSSAKRPTAKPATKKNNGVNKQSNTDRSKPGNEEKKDDSPVHLNEKPIKEEQPTSKVFLCDHCGATFLEKTNLQIHLLRHAEKKFKCTKCTKVFLREWDLNNHNKRHDNIRSHVCDLCGKAFYEKKTLNGHISFVHNKAKPKKRTYKCQFCDQTYLYKRGVVIHERSVHTGERPDVCQTCGASFYDIVYLREHMRIHTGDTPFKCPVCQRGYTQIGNMKSHMRNHKISQLDQETAAKIKPNYFKFMRPLLFLKLLESFKQKPNPQSSARKPVAEICKLCDLCGRVFRNADQLARHKVYVHGDKSHKCSQCPKTYSTRRQLKLHFLRHHENVRKAVCDYCGKSFFAKSDVKNHIDSIHLNKKRKVSSYKCRFCEKSYTYKKGATIHERAVHTGERPAICDVCGNSFYDENYLKEHMRLHTGDTPYKCPVCGRGYAQRGNMKSHMRNHRISELEPDTLAKIKPSYFKFMRP